MKHTYLLAIALLGLVGLTAPVAAQATSGGNVTPKLERDMKKHAENVAREVEKKKEAEEIKTVPQAIEALEFFNGKPSTKAKYYIYLHSASWCGPCRALMPKLIKEYPAMKKAKVEIILIGYDDSVEKATEYITHYDKGISGILYTNPEVQKLPGFAKPEGIPYATIVSRKGKVLYNGFGNGALNWKEICSNKKKKKK